MRLFSLQFLFLQENSLHVLPEELFPTFRLLRRLDVRRNKLTCIPANIGDHQCLEVLLLQDNQISTLPPHLGKEFEFDVREQNLKLLHSSNFKIGGIY